MPTTAGGTSGHRVVAAAIIAAVVAAAVAFKTAAAARERRSFVSRGGQRVLKEHRELRSRVGRGPYNLQLYDSPFYYPYYKARDLMAAWDRSGRCVAYCSASEDGGCAVACR